MDKSLRELTEELTLRDRALRENEARMRRIINTMSEFIVEVDLKGVETYVSPPVWNVLGRGPSETLGKSAFHHIHPDDRDYCKQCFTDAVVRRIPVILQFRILHGRGYYVWVEASGTPITADDGRITGLIIVGRDITDRKRLEQTCLETAQKYRTLVNSMHEFIMEVDRQGTVINTSDVIEKITGIPSADFIGHNCMEGVHPDDMKEVWSAFSNSLDIEQELYSAKVMRYRFKKANGQWIWIETGGSALRDDKGHATGAILVGRDVSERVEHEEAMKDSERLFKSLFCWNPVPMALTSVPDGKYIKVNKAMCDHFGVEESEFLGKSTINLGIMDLVDHRKLFVDIGLNGYVSDFPVQLKVPGSDNILVGKICCNMIKMDGTPYVLVSMVVEDKILGSIPENASTST